MRTVLSLLVLLVVAESAIAVGPNRADAKLLEENRIETTLAGIVGYLRQLKPDAALQAKAKQLVEQLSASEFDVREAATSGLIELPMLPLDLLREAEASSDLEIAFRAKKILGHSKTAEKRRRLRRGQEVTAAILRAIRDTPIKEATTVVLEVAPFFESWELTHLAAETVATIAGSSDIELLRRSIDSEDVATRVIAIRGLGQAAGQSAQSQLRQLCNDLDPQIVLSAAHALAAQSDRAAFAPLIKLLVEEDARIRAVSVQILRGLTQRSFELNPIANPETQTAQLERWKTWLAEESLTAPLHLPLKLEPLREDLGRGILLHYAFDLSDDRRLPDSSGHGRHGTLHNAAAFSREDGREVLTVDGQGHHGDGGGHATIPYVDFASQEQFTLVLWVNELGLSHPEGEAYVTFGTDRGVGTEDALGIAHFNSQLFFRVGDGAVTVPFDVADRGRWIHYGMTFNNGRLRAYRNGKLIGEADARVSITSKTAGLARHWWGDGLGTSTRFQGALDDLRVYDRALTAQEIELLTNVPD